MADRRGIFGWMMYDWASQPFNTLIITFIFAPYFASAVAPDPVTGQAMWGYASGIAGILIALMSPVLGVMADRTGPRKPWILGFSVLYVLGSFMLWYAMPGSVNPISALIWYGIGLIGMEMTVTFNNAMLPGLGTADEVGRISGSGWALGYVGGLFALVLMLLFMSASGPGGTTLIGFDPAVIGLDPATRAGDRASGPLTAIWYVIFIIPMFLWTPDEHRSSGIRVSIAGAVRDLWQTLKALPGQRSYGSYLLSSMFYRDALNGLYTFGGIYAAGVLGWSITQIGIFGIVASAAGALGAWIGGKFDSRLGSRPVIQVCIWVLILVSAAIILTSRTQVIGIPVAEGSAGPTILFYICGALIGAAGGSLQAASRTMLVHQADPDKVTEAFGLYALTGKATAFLAPLGIAIATDITQSQRLGVIPVVILFLIGLWLFRPVTAARGRP